MKFGATFASKALKTDPKTVISSIKKHQIPLSTAKDLDPLIHQIGDAKFVLLGEATHGTSEFYQWRAQISKRLIEEKGFRFIAVEGDFPDCYEANKYIKSAQKESKVDSKEVLINSFKRWPTWMWANWEIADLLEWLKQRNSSLSTDKQIGFYGLDVYSLYESLESIMKFVKELKDPDAIEAATAVYQCFQPFAKDPIKYGHSTSKKKFEKGCKMEVVNLLKCMKAKYNPTFKQALGMKEEEKFAAQMNSKILFDAENYYQVMISSGPESWNVRDDHMADTLDSLMNFHGPNAKCIVWAHNTHIGDARFTDMIEQGERNLGQIVRERHEKEGVFLVGFGTNEGTVIAGEAWDAQWEDLMVPSAPANSWEWMFKQAEEKNDTSDKLLIFPQLPKEDRKIFEEVRGHRAIGVVYDPAMDRFGHWVPTVLGKRYDAFIYVDKTKSLHPLPDEPDLELQPPMTYPWGALV